MSYIQNGPWTPAEKVNLLVNVLQNAFPDLPTVLLQIIHEHQVYPKWNDIPLPTGRSLHSSQIAFEEMSRLYRQQGRQPAQQPIPIHYTPTPNIAPAVPQQQPRPFHEPEIYHTQQRALQPRPPRSTDSPVPAVTNGEMAPLLRTLAPESIQEVRKKRGRPSKEEAEERDRALAAEGKVYQPKKRPNKKLRASTGTPGPESSTARDTAPTTPLHTPLRRASGHTQPFSEDHGPTGGKPPTADDDDEHLEKPALTVAHGPGHDEPVEARSPSDRLLANHRERQPSPAHPPARGPPHEDTAQR